jgi:hypothetical protein
MLTYLKTFPNQKLKIKDLISGGKEGEMAQTMYAHGK